MRILVAGIGNIFFGDDAFGCEVVKRLALPEHVRVFDYGIRGFDLAFALLEDYDAFILVDAVPRGEAPGTLFTIEVDTTSLDETGAEDMMVETHGMNPLKVLAMVKAMGGNPRHVYVVGCEPSPQDEESMGLSEPVQAALDGAVEMIEALVSKLTEAKGDDHEQCVESVGDRGSSGGDHRRVA